MISEQIDHLVSPCRDALARGLIRVGLRPNHVTVVGMLLTVGAGVAIAAGEAHWRAWAVSLIVAAGAADLLDGAMAKVGNLRTPFGATLDSICDRVGDAALYLGATFYFMTAALGRADAAPRPNLTLAVLSAAGLVWAYLVSYIRARAGAEVPGALAGGGFWQRPERVVTLILGLAFHHLPTAAWILGTLPLTTVALRIWRSKRVLSEETLGNDDPRGLLGIVLWRHRRGTVPFDIYAGAVILTCVLVDVPAADPLGRLVAWWVGA
jgi:CDP-diacylglycerol--glycerol-3-phosphate 3-phosphatidyltransferase